MLARVPLTKVVRSEHRQLLASLIRPMIFAPQRDRGAFHKQVKIVTKDLDLQSRRLAAAASIDFDARQHFLTTIKRTGARHDE